MIVKPISRLDQKRLEVLNRKKQLDEEKLSRLKDRSSKKNENNKHELARIKTIQSKIDKAKKENQKVDTVRQKRLIQDEENRRSKITEEIERKISRDLNNGPSKDRNKILKEIISRLEEDIVNQKTNPEERKSFQEIKAAALNLLPPKKWAKNIGISNTKNAKYDPKKYQFRKDTLEKNNISEVRKIETNEKNPSLLDEYGSLLKDKKHTKLVKSLDKRFPVGFF